MSTPQPESRPASPVILHMGRSCIDLYSVEIGVAFEEITAFNAYVGGSPTNTCVGVQRLGLQTVLLTAVGADPVGDFVLNFLRREGVDTRYIPRKAGHRTSCVLLGIEPPDRFPLVYYREKCADIQLNFDDVLAAPIAECAIVQIAGTNFSRDPCAGATRFAAETARGHGVKVVLDLDFRPDQWQDPRFFGTAIRTVLPLVDIVIGTVDEINAVMLSNSDQIELAHSQVSDAKVAGDTAGHVQAILNCGVDLVIEKRGKHGCCLHQRATGCTQVPGYPVTVKNILGAGDAFAAGFLYGYANGWDPYRAGRLGNACGAIVVTRHGCSHSMPRFEEILEFVQDRGGLE